MKSTATYDSAMPEVFLAPERLQRLTDILNRLRDLAAQDWRTHRNEFLQLQGELNALIPPP
jgi:hypothetical protein